MPKVRKEKFNLEEGQAYVVANSFFWDHVISVYESQAENSDDEWQQMANHIRDWVDATLFVEEEGDDWS